MLAYRKKSNPRYKSKTKISCYLPALMGQRFSIMPVIVWIRILKIWRIQMFLASKFNKNRQERLQICQRFKRDFRAYDI